MVPQPVIDRLWDEGKIAIHFEDLPSTDEHNYNPPGRKALKRLKDYCNTGAIVGASYAGKSKDMLVGEIPPKSEVKLLDFKKEDGSSGWLKTVNLDNWHIVNIYQYPVLFSTRPRSVTLWSWDSVQEVLDSAIKGTAVPMKVKSLAPAQLEVLCYQYLLKHKLIYGLLWPIGRTLPDLDIVGLDSSGDYVASQVTQSSSPQETKEKIERLAKYSAEHVKLYFFGAIPNFNPDEVTSGIKYISIEDVFSDMRSGEDTDRLVKRLLCPILPT